MGAAKTSKELNAYIKRFKNLHADHSLVEQHVHLADWIATQTSKKMKFKRKLEHEFALLCQTQVPNQQSAEDYLEEMIGSGKESITRVLLFFILISLTQGGISSKKYEILKKNVIQSYGYEHILSLDLLEKFLLISRYETLKRLYSSASEYFNWSTIKNKFSLCKSKSDLDFLLTPSVLGQFDINLIGGYANGGYAPLSARLVEAATRVNGWRAIQSEMRELKGKCYPNETMLADAKSKTKKVEEEEKESQQSIFSINNLLANNKDPQSKAQRQETRKQKAQQKSDAMSASKTVLVFFVGGVTYAEISAIRMLESRPNTPWKFIIASTNIANGDDIVNAFINHDLS